MPDEKEVYEKHAFEYEALLSHEDFQGNILKSVQEIIDLDGLDVLDLGTGTGRLACLLAPCVRTMLAFDLSPHMLGIARECAADTVQDARADDAAAVPIIAFCPW